MNGNACSDIMKLKNKPAVLNLAKLVYFCVSRIETADEELYRGRIIWI